MDKLPAVNFLFAALAVLSLGLTLWQWIVARRFPLHQRLATKSFVPAVTLLKPLKGCDPETAACLRSWLAQDYAGPMQFLFGVAAADDAVCEVVRALLAEFPQRNAQLVVCPEALGANAKVSTLIQLERRAAHEVIVISDADVRVPADFLSNAVVSLRDEQVGLVNCFYQLANPTTTAMRWEAVAVNADFWSSVLQSRSLAPLDFALGAAMVTRRQQLAEIGGFAALVNCLADDYQLGHRIARGGHRIELTPVVVECWSAPMDWRAVWRHQLRWARTMRVSKPLGYFFSIVTNATLWPALWVAAFPGFLSVGFLLVSLIARILTALHLQWKLTRSAAGDAAWWLVPVKDLLAAATWLLAFTGNRIEWRGDRYRLRRAGTLEKI